MRLAVATSATAISGAHRGEMRSFPVAAPGCLGPQASDSATTSTVRGSAVILRPLATSTEKSACSGHEM
ncbi:hypothetical protein [Lysobacter gummosus]|uniref:hypothetical protein n=1 Tax=Lysobacter gummosus TaxID=262324 RepID=UPI00362CA473